MYVVGSGYRVERPGGDSGSGGGCALGESANEASGIFLAVLLLFLSVSLIKTLGGRQSALRRGGSIFA